MPTIIKTKSELLECLRNPPTDSIIYVDDSAEIDLTGEQGIRIPANITLRSGRGKNGPHGGLIFTKGLISITPDKYSLFKLFLIDDSSKGTVILSGIRLWGPITEVAVGQHSYWRGIELSSTSCDLVIENCELWGWNDSAIALTNSSRGRIVNNYIHHNRGAGYGYGVSLDFASFAVIEENLFDYNRHAIAGSGRKGQIYEARYNVIGPHQTIIHYYPPHVKEECIERNHDFDMHLSPDSTPADDLAGEKITIEHNLFLSKGGGPAIKIRGTPEKICPIQNNKFAWKTKEEAIVKFRNQGSQFDDSYKNLAISDDNEFDIPNKAGYVAWGGKSFWQYLRVLDLQLSKLAFGDFNRSGRTDILIADDSNFWVTSGSGFTFHKIRPSDGFKVRDLAFGDFNGDGYLEILVVKDGSFQMSKREDSGKWSAWEILRPSDGLTINDIALGDFNGVGRTDILIADDSNFWVTSGSGFTFHKIRPSDGLKVSQLALEDFNGVGRTDILIADDSNFWVTSGSGFTFHKIRPSDGFKVRDLAFGDFNGDGYLEILVVKDGSFQMSKREDSGKWSAWEILRPSDGLTINDIVLGDFNGDGQADIFRCSNSLLDEHESIPIKSC